MQKLKVKNFGPIGENKNDTDGFFTVNISPVTVFIGETAICKNTAKQFYEKCKLIEYPGEIILSEDQKDIHLFSFQPLVSKKIWIEVLF